MSVGHWAEKPERGSFWVMRLGLRLMKWFGYRTSVVVCSLAIGYFFVTGRSSRRASLGYLRRLHSQNPSGPKPGLWQAFLHHWQFGIGLLDRMWFWSGRLDDFHFTSQGSEHILKRNCGLLLVGAHFGSFDALRAFSQDRDMAVNVIMYRANARRINRLLEQINPEANVRIIELDGGSVDQIFSLQQKLEAGELLAILADRLPVKGRQRVTELPFLGQPAGFPQNPWILASLLGCPVVMINGVRVGWRRYHIVVEPIAEKVVLPRATRAASIGEYISQYVSHLEGLCLRYPFQWFNFYDFWRKHAML